MPSKETWAAGPRTGKRRICSSSTGNQSTTSSTKTTSACTKLSTSTSRLSKTSNSISRCRGLNKPRQIALSRTCSQSIVTSTQPSTKLTNLHNDQAGGPSRPCLKSSRTDLSIAQSTTTPWRARSWTTTNLMPRSRFPRTVSVC